MNHSYKSTQTLLVAAVIKAHAVRVLVSVAVTFTWFTVAAGQGTADPALTTADVVDKPELMHARLLAANPGYTAQAQFAKDPDMGLVGDLSSEPVIADLSPLKGVPFNALDLRGLQVSDLAPLSGMPLKVLCLEGTRVTDLTPLKGMKLEKLYLNDTEVRDLSPLSGMPLTEMILIGSLVENLEPLRGAPLQSLWLNGLSVADIEPLAKSPLVSLTLEGTRVSELAPLSGMTSLRRLHIAVTPVTDLTPLKGLHITRLIFTPSTVTKGVESVRAMPTITELGTAMGSRMSPEQFWALYDQGRMK